MSPIIIRPHMLRQFGSPYATHFYLVTNPCLADKFLIDSEPLYLSSTTLLYDNDTSIEDLLQTDIEPKAHILVISPQVFFESPSKQILGNSRKLLVLPCNSTPIDLCSIAYFIEAIENSNPQDQEVFAANFFSQLDDKHYIEISDYEYSSLATLQLVKDTYEWFLQGGFMEEGAQQLAPSGEISILPMKHGNYNPNMRFHLNGTIVLKGFPIVHSGRPSFMYEDQHRIYEELSCISNHAIIANIKKGMITSVKPAHPSAAPAVAMLEALFKVDSRYRVIWEIGFGINSSFKPLIGNIGMNEVYGGLNGCIHWGIGLTPWTQFHIDIVCPSTTVIAGGENVIIGSQKDL